MSWVRFDDQCGQHPKVLAAGALAGWLWFKATVYCSLYRTDGYLPTAILPSLATFDDALVPVDTPPALEAEGEHHGQAVDVYGLAEHLEAIGLWEMTPCVECAARLARAQTVAPSRVRTIYVHAYLEYNPSRAEIDQSRADRVRAGKYGGIRSTQARAQARAKADAVAPSQAPAQARDVASAVANAQAKLKHDLKQSSSKRQANVNPDARARLKVLSPKKVLPPPSLREDPPASGGVSRVSRTTAKAKARKFSPAPKPGKTEKARGGFGRRPAKVEPPPASAAAVALTASYRRLFAARFGTPAPAVPRDEKTFDNLLRTHTADQLEPLLEGFLRNGTKWSREMHAWTPQVFEAQLGTLISLQKAGDL